MQAILQMLPAELAIKPITGIEVLNAGVVE